MTDINYSIIEGALYLSGEEGISIKQLQNLLGCKKVEAVQTIENYKALIAQDSSRGLIVKKLGEVYKFVTKPEHKEYYTLLTETKSAAKLSSAATETLAIIAYKQPITRMEIEDIRGVGSDAMLRKLIAKDLIEETGRTEGPGRPVLFGVTKTFMDHFGLESLKELPEIKKSTDEQVDGVDIFATRFTDAK